MSNLFRLKTYINYWLEAVDGHSLHSPFFFDFYTKVIKQKANVKTHEGFEVLREKLRKDDRIIFVKDYGVGPSNLNSAERKISDIAKTSVTPYKFTNLYNRIIAYYNTKNIVELGTSLGINTLYLATNKDSKVTTFEGSPEIAGLAQTTFEFSGAQNITLIEGDIDITLPSYLQSVGKIDLAFIDANHRYGPTLKYFEWLIQKIHHQSVFILDDIHYSKEMEKAWKEICRHKLVYGSVDLYRCGVLFFDPSLNKQHVILQF